MKSGLGEIIQESIRLELNAAALYLLLHRQFPEDAAFWWQLAIEEKNHAALARSISDIFSVVDGLPEGIFAGSAGDLRKANLKVEALTGQYTANRPSREEAFCDALAIELLAGEIHYQSFMTRDLPHGVAKIFKELNGDDANHARRIRKYMRENGIGPEKNSI